MRIDKARWRPLLAGTAALALLLGAACGGDDDGGGADATSTATSAAPTATEAVEGTETPDATESPATGDGEGGDSEAAGSLAELSEMLQDASFSVTYNMNTSIEGEAIEGEWTWYLDAAGQRARFDISDLDPSMPGTMTVITTPEDTLLCFEGACISGGLPGVADPSGELFDTVDSVDDVAMSGSVRAAGTRSVAGVEAQCFEFDNETEGIETGVVCLSPEGVPLFSEWSSAEGDFSMEATSYSAEVGDADFEPPFPVTELPTN